MHRLPIIGLLVVFTSCSPGSRGKLLPHTEVVLTPGMTITATNSNGTVRIEADGKATRTFIGDGWKKQLRLIPRPTRWYGSLGLYDPAPAYRHGGRVLVDEGRLFFESENEALRYLYVGSERRRPVFTNRGLVFAYDVAPVRGDEPVRTIQIWQIYINNQMPTSMRGADDSAIEVTGGAIPESASPNASEVGYELVLGDEEYQPQKSSRN